MARVTKADKTILDEALDRFDVAQEAWQDTYTKGLEDVRFVDGDDDQWADTARTARKDRPTMTFDKLSGAVDQVVGDHLQNKPGLKVIGAEDDDAETAEIYEGLIRQIESRGTRAYKTGFKFAVKGGFGAWMVRHDYLDPESFEQDLILDEIKNPFSVLLDPAIQTTDVWKGRYGFVWEDFEKDEFEQMYPKAKSATSENFKMTGSMHKWISKDNVRVANYFRLVKVDRTIGLTEDRKVLYVDEHPEANFIDTREVEVDKLECYRITALEVLERKECIGKYIPIIPIFGKTSNIDGEFVSRGLVRKAKDAQRLYNYERSNYIETVALQPKQPYFVTPKMVEGHEENWRNMNIKNDPAIPYNPDPEAPGGMPKRERSAEVPQGLVAGLQMSSDDIKSTTGIYDASLGARSNETSGKAIRARQSEGDTANFEFTDEFAEAIKYTGMIFVNLIPKVYDTHRMIRILGEDDAESIMEINQPVRGSDPVTGEPKWVKQTDLSKGKYDIRVRVGQSFTTRRIETAEQLGAIIAQNPEMSALIGDVYYKSLDLVGGDEVVERWRKMAIRRGIVDPTDEERQEMAQQGQSPQAQLQKRLKQKEQQLDLAEKQAKINKDNAAAANSRMDAIAKQMEIQIQQQDIQGLAQSHAMLLQLVRGSTPMVALQ